jgi:PKD repeat protein
MDGEAGGNYNDAVMNVDNVYLEIRKTTESQNNYRLIQGPFADSYISHGARLNTTRYPSYQQPFNNTTIEIADPNRIGSSSSTGIRAYAYDTQPYDDYFYADFNTRIHENDNYGQSNAVYATSNGDARYPDGDYFARARIITVTGEEFESEESEFRIDNFLPFVKDVIIRQNNENGDIAYRGEWTWDGTELSLEQENFNDIGIEDRIYIKVVASESLYDLNLQIPTISVDTYFPINANEDFTEWEFELEPHSTMGTYFMNFTGEDLAGNLLETMSANPTANIPIRQSDGTWIPAASPGNDTNHFFNIGTAVCEVEGGSNQRVSGAISGCLYVDFSIDNSYPKTNEVVTFLPIVSGSGALNYNWQFGEGATPSGSNSSDEVFVVYNSPGLKTVSLEICDASGNCLVETKTDMIDVNGIGAPLEVDFTSTSRTIRANEPITLTSTISGFGAGAIYYWDFGAGAIYSSNTVANPVVSYGYEGNKNISLTITDVNGTKSVVKNSYIYVYQPPAIGIKPDFTGCVTDGEVNSPISFFNLSTGGSRYPHDYEWNFGDGTTSNDMNPTHIYGAKGVYTVSLKACDDFECVTYTSPGCVVISWDVGEGQVQADFLINDRELNEPQYTIVGYNTPVRFTNISRSRLGNPLDEFIWNFNVIPDGSIQAFPASATTAGPHTVYYKIDRTTEYIDVSLSAGYLNSSIGDVERKASVIKIEKGRGSGDCMGEIGAVTLNTSCWKSGGPYPMLDIPFSSDCDLYAIAFDIDGNMSRVENDGISLSGVTSFPVTRTIRVELIHDDGVSLSPLVSENFEYTFYEEPNIQLGTDLEICKNEQIEIGIENNDTFKYDWTSTDPDANSYLSDLTVSNPVFSGLESGVFTYNLKVTDLSCGCSSSDEITITVNDLLAEDLSFDIGLNNTYTLNVPVSGGNGPIAYLWSPSLYLSSNSGQNPNITTPTNEEFLTYVVDVTDNDGCTDQAKIYVNITPVPSQFEASAESFSHILVTWSDNTTDETGFIIERSENGGTFVEIASTAPNTTEYHDYSVIPDVNYSYRITAIRPSGQTNYSSVIEINTNSLPLFVETNMPHQAEMDLGEVEWGDYDSDGDLDLFFIGRRYEGHSRLFKNNGGQFELQDDVINTDRSGYFGRSEWGDYDNDGDLDLAIQDAFELIILTNIGNGFVQSFHIEHAPSSYTSICGVAWSDLDGDHDLDLIAADREELKVIINNNNVFSRLDINETNWNGELISVSDGDIVIADFYNDGNPNVLLASGSSVYIVEISYENSSFSFNSTKLFDLSLYRPSIEKYDVDLDGDTDFLLTDSWTGSRIYLNDNGFSISNYIELLPFTSGDASGDGAFGDYNNDGRIDVLAASQYQSILLKNSLEGFSDMGIGLPGRHIGNVDWGDYDNDGDMDFSMIGHDQSNNLFAQVFTNSNGKNEYRVNTKPSSPESPCTIVNGTSAVLQWLPGADNETPEDGLTYNIYVGSQEGAVDHTSPNADLVSGQRKIMEYGNVGHNTIWELHNLPPLFEWGVQTIDQAYAGSEFIKGTAISEELQPLLTISNQTYDDTFNNQGDPFKAVDINVYEASLKSGSRVVMRASNAISLSNGFHAEKGSSLSIRAFTPTIPCPSSGSRIGKENLSFIDVESGGFISIYPNPTNENVILSFGLEDRSDLSIKIFNLSGNLMEEFELYNILSEERTIDLERFKNGVYIVKIEGYTFSHSSKLMVFR